MSGSSDPEIRAVAETIFAELLSDLILSTTIAAHREVKRNAVICGTCGTYCRSHHPIPSTSNSNGNAGKTLKESSQPPSRGSTPLVNNVVGSSSSTSSTAGEGRREGYLVGPEKGTGGGTGIGSGSGRIDSSGNAFFDCLVCGRAVASNRYAPHLSSCLGFNGSTRRGASRMAAAKARLGANDRSSPSPYMQSENGDSDVDSVTGSRNGKKPKLNGNGKRGISPSKPNIGKKSKMSSGTVTPSQRPPHPPSRLGRPPATASQTQSSTELSSPISSPERSAGESLPTLSTPTVSGINLGGGSTGRKTLPGLGVGYVNGTQEVGAGVAGIAEGYESSEGADDDY